MAVTQSASQAEQLDVLIVGAGFAGLYQLERLRSLGFSVRVHEAAPALGGVWYWNCYPGARTDSNGPIYQYSREDLWRDWDYDELYPSWAAVRDYFTHVDDKLELSKDIEFGRRVRAAEFDCAENLWTVDSDGGPAVRARYVVLCTGFGSSPLYPRIDGLDEFSGECHHTARWPQEGLDLTGKRVGVIGTGASGVQVIQELAPIASHLTVFQRTPNMALPMRQRKLDDCAKRRLKQEYPERLAARASTFAGFDLDFLPSSAHESSEDERERTFEDLWAKGGFHPWLGTFHDVLGDERANDAMYRFWRSKVHRRVEDPRVAELLAPKTPPHPFGVKRPSLEQNYYEMFNRDNVQLVDLKATPIQHAYHSGLRTTAGTHELDAIVLATGFDANTGGLTAIDIRSTTGESLEQRWSAGVDAALGVATAGFPNMVFVYGPQSPAAFCNGPTCAEIQGEEIVKLLTHARDSGAGRFEARADADKAWTEELNAIFDASLFTRADSWYLGANVPGKPRQMLNYPGGVPAYFQRWADVVQSGYTSAFTFA